jgi:hypothetical protein
LPASYFWRIIRLAAKTTSKGIQVPTVFVTQVPNRRDKDTKMLVPSVNIGPAAEHGEIKIIFPAQAAFFATQDLVRQIEETMKGYNYEAGDCVVALGDPSIIGAVCAWLGKNKGRFTMLKWDRNISRYITARISV